MRELLLVGYIMAVGLCVAAAATHFYQAVRREPAMLRYDGATYWHALGNLVMSFVCGPYIMLQLGWRQQSDGTISLSVVLFAASLAFGWAFFTGMLFLGGYLAIFG